MSETTETRSRLWLWIYFGMFALAVVGFTIAKANTNVENMVFHGFTGMLWYACAAKERDTK